jgi:hypothetical protein
MATESGGRKKGPTKQFQHADDCRILKADPNVEIPWSEVRRGVWEARCVCGFEYHNDPVADDRVRNDPLKIHRGAPYCELHGETDPAVLRLGLKATEKDGYWGAVFRLRHRLAGCALCRERRVTTNSVGDLEVPRPAAAVPPHRRLMPPVDLGPSMSAASSGITCLGGRSVGTVLAWPRSLTVSWTLTC